MRLMIFAAVAALALAPAASFAAAGSAGTGKPPAVAAGPYKLDVKGKCHAANGQFAKQNLCATIPPIFKLDAAGKCHAANGQFAPASKCKKP